MSILIKKSYFPVLHKFLFVGASVIGLSSFCIAATVSGGNASISFSELPSDFHSVVLLGPNGFYYVSESPSINSETSFTDGQYTYQIKITTTATQNAFKQQMNNGRSKNTVVSNSGVKVLIDGTFLVENGQVIDPNSQQTEQE